MSAGFNGSGASKERRGNCQPRGRTALSEAAAHPSGVQPVIVVAGLGRCGSSLMMQMLCAGGVACVGEWPAFEPEIANHRPLGRKWLSAQAGCALKVLNPHITTIPADVPGVAIWLDRDPREQARSMMKFAHLVGGWPRADRAHVRRVAASLPVDRRRALDALPPGWPRLHLDYEQILLRPAWAILSLQDFLAPWRPQLDPDAMLAAIRKGEPRCAEGVDMEMTLLAEAACHG